MTTSVDQPAVRSPDLALSGSLRGFSPERLARFCAWTRPGSRAMGAIGIIFLSSGLVDVRVIDMDGVYDPYCPNDRLLLGIKSSINEFELSVLRVRMSCASACQSVIFGLARPGWVLTRTFDYRR